MQEAFTPSSFKIASVKCRLFDIVFSSSFNRDRRCEHNKHIHGPTTQTYFRHSQTQNKSRRPQGSKYITEEQQIHWSVSKSITLCEFRTTIQRFRMTKRTDTGLNPSPERSQTPSTKIRMVMNNISNEFELETKIVLCNGPAN